MPVVTRSQHKIIQTKNTLMFKKTLENPCVLQNIISNLDMRDLINMKRLSKDSQFNDEINHKMQKIQAHKQRVKNVSATIKHHLDEIEDTNGVNNKLRVVNNMYTFICENKWFVDEQRQFAVVVHTKLFELMKQQPSEFQKSGIQYLNKLFNVKPPKDYYNSRTGLSQFGLFDMNNKFIPMNKYV